MKIKIGLFLFSCFLNAFSQNTNKILKIEYDFFLNIGAEKQHYNSSLFVDASSSLFKWGNVEKKVKTESGNKDNKFSVTLFEADSIGTYNFINHKTDSIFSRLIWFKSKVYKIHEKKSSIKWEIMDETKKVGTFNCQKAIGEFRGRTYTAWFTTKLPVSASPWKLHGLPGLVLKVHDSENKIQFVFKSISKIDEMPNLPIEDSKIISIEDYSKMQNTLANELSKKIISKMPRGAKIEITSTETIEIFN